jgi:hypothetical protein
VTCSDTRLDAETIAPGTGRTRNLCDTELLSKVHDLREQTESAGPNPRRVAAGRLNRTKRGEVSPEGKQRLREAALRSQLWTRSTGPRTAAGKARAARNGKKRQIGSRSVRELRAEMAGIMAEIASIRAVRLVLSRRA